MPSIFGGQGIVPSSRGIASSQIPLAAGDSYLLPAGRWRVDCGTYLNVQAYDPLPNMWRSIGSQGNGIDTVDSDGFTIRVANQTGCAVGAVITNAGTGYTSAPAVAASSGASVWQAIVGGAISTTITVTLGGSNYTYPPTLIVSSPGNPGIQANATCALTSGAISSVTVVNQGAGYLVAPTVTVINDPRDTTGSGAVLTTALTGSGTITGLICTNHGTPLTAVPTLTFTGGGGASAAATVVMNFAITAYTVTSGGTYTSADPVIDITGSTALTAATPIYTNPSTQLGLVHCRRAWIKGALSSTAVTATGLQVIDGGCYEIIPQLSIQTNSPVTTAAVLVAVVGGVTDTATILAG